MSGPETEKKKDLSPCKEKCKSRKPKNNPGKCSDAEEGVLRHCTAYASWRGQGGPPWQIHHSLLLWSPHRSLGPLFGGEGREGRGCLFASSGFGYLGTVCASFWGWVGCQWVAAFFFAVTRRDLARLLFLLVTAQRRISNSSNIRFWPKAPFGGSIGTHVVDVWGAGAVVERKGTIIVG